MFAPTSSSELLLAAGRADSIALYDALGDLRFPMGVNIGGVQEALGRVWALCRVFTYSKQAPSSAVPTDAARTVCRSDPYSRNRRRQIRSCRW